MCIRERMKNTLKCIIGLCSSFNPLLLRRIRAGLTVFVFHDVGDRPTEFQRKYGLSISKRDFERQVDWIRDHFVIVSPKSLLDSSFDFSNGALITFDDGYAGTFNNALPILQERKCESLVLLNMGHIEQKTPLISALISYLEANDPAFHNFCREHNLISPVHLSITPYLLSKYQSEFKLPAYEVIEEYCGGLASLSVLDAWDKTGVYYGNHLYEHWNYSSLTAEEFRLSYIKNKMSLDRYSNYLDIFAFTNGVHPDLTDEVIKVGFCEFGMVRAFTSQFGINEDKNKFYLGRVPFGPSESSAYLRWFRLSRS